MIPHLALVALAPALSLAAPVKAEQLWRQWYLVTRDGKAVSAYEETAESRPQDAEIAVTQKWTERVDGKKTEAYIGAVASAAKLEPVAFFVERSGARAYKIDGRAREGSLSVTFKPGGGPAKAKGSIAVKPGTYLSSLLPLAITRHLAEKGAFQFTAIVEDDGAMNVEVKSGIVEIQGVEKKIGQESCQQALLRLDGGIQEWWITRQGKTCLVVFPGTGTRLETASEAAAKKALAAP